MKHIISTITLSTALLMGANIAYALPQGAPDPHGPNANEMTPKQVEQIQQNKKKIKNPQTDQMMQQVNKTQKVLPNLETNQ